MALLVDEELAVPPASEAVTEDDELPMMTVGG